MKIQLSRLCVLLCLTSILIVALPSSSFSQPDTGAPDMNEDSAESKPEQDKSIQMLFIHHSCGGQLLAEKGARIPIEGVGDNSCIYFSHPNGGSLRSQLEDNSFVVNEASYGSIVGAETDIQHWNLKFRDHMSDILRIRLQDEKLPEGTTNQIVAFKSCFPNNRFTGQGTSPGDPNSPDLTITNAKASYLALLPYFSDNSEVLFVVFTAPPLADAKPVGIKAKLKRFFSGKPKHPQLAREFNTWLVDRNSGWLASYNLSNVVVFDYFNILTKGGQTDWSAFPTADGRDSHPSSEGNQQAAAEFIPYIEAAYKSFAGVQR